MLTKTETAAKGRHQEAQTAAQAWLAEFQEALAAGEPAGLASLFQRHSYWRDVLALTWRIMTIEGADAIVSELGSRAKAAQLGQIAIATDRTAPRWAMRAGTDTIEAIFRFETARGRGSGVLRLTPDAGDGGKLKAWTLLTALDEIKGYEEKP